MTNQVNSVRAGYDRWAAVYDHDANPLQALEGPIVREMAGDVRGLNVLDLGCGTGRHSLWLAQCGANVTAIDFSQGMLAEARRKQGAESIRFIAHDLHQPLPLADATFDLVISGLVLEHLSNLDNFFSEIKRVIKPSDRAVISAMHPAMFLRDARARFTDPQSSVVIEPGSIAHSISDFLTSALTAGWSLRAIKESAPDAEFVTRYPRAAKYLDWPMLVVISLA